MSAEGIEPVVAAQFIYEALSPDAEILAGVGLNTKSGAPNIYDGPAGDGATYPLITMHMQAAGAQLEAMGMERIWGEVLMTVKVVGKGNSYAPIKGIFQRVHTLLQGRESPAGDGQILMCVRETAIAYPETDNGVTYRHLGGVYRLYAR